jgi:FkbM family methyltransferase
MLFTSFETYLKEKKGALHIGAHEGGERDWYVKQGFAPVIWFEPNKELFQRLVCNIQSYENQVAYNIGIHDTLKNVNLHIASNNGQSSSILELGTHKYHHPKVHYVGKQKIELVRMDDFLQEHTININEFNFLNIDVQGVELSVIKSFGGLINTLDYIYTEVNEEELYIGCCLVGDIDKYLSQYEFTRVTTHMTKNKWGDALYIKKNLL